MEKTRKRERLMRVTELKTVKKGKKQ